MRVDLARAITEIPPDWTAAIDSGQGICRWNSPDGGEEFILLIGDSYRWQKDGRLHREGGPAVVYTSGVQFWYRCGWYTGGWLDQVGF